MQLLCVHADAFGFEARNPDPTLETAGDQTGADLAGAVVVFVAVEPRDVGRIETTTREAADVIGEVTDQLNTEQVALVPCRQLTDSPAENEQADAVLDRLAPQLDAVTLARVPTGWNIAFDIETKAHPFSIQHSRVDPTADTDATEWQLFRDGTLRPLSPDSLDADTSAVLDWERATTDPGEPAYATTGSAFGLFDTEDDGTVFFRPRGVLARTLLESYVTDVLTEYGAVAIDRSGTVDRSVFSSLSLSPTDLPCRVFTSRHSPRELADENRWLPAATVPELSTLVADRRAAVAEACQQAALIHRLWSALGLSYEPVLRVGGEAGDDEQVAALAALFGRPVLVERRPTADWLLKLEFQTLSAGQPVTTPTILIEETTGLSGDWHDLPAPTVVRSLPAGAIERTLGALLASTDPPGIPTWLAPVQFRFVPITPSEHLAYCDRLADQFEAAGIRVDIDDRGLAVRERLATAKNTGIPYYTVIGDDELDTDRLGVIARNEHSETTMSPDELQALLTDRGPDQPKTNPLPRRLRSSSVV